MTIRLGINASRAISGGARAHLIGILANAKPSEYSIEEIHVWSHVALLSEIPDAPWLIKHPILDGKWSVLRKLFWERFELPRELYSNMCSCLLNIDAGSICRFRPSITMSRDMLSYEEKESRRFGFSKARLRLIVLRFVQNASFRSSDGVIFLTNYARIVIQKSCGFLPNVAIIPHGIGQIFKDIDRSKVFQETKPIRCLYISNTLPYKHQWNVVKAIDLLRKNGHNLSLDLVGGGEGQAQKRLASTMSQISDPEEFIQQHEFASHRLLVTFLENADVFIFASSCENMPNTLLEAMAAGLPIACSDCGPMPEVLEDGGVYFDPENPVSISNAIKEILSDDFKRDFWAANAKKISQKYDWDRCSNETFSFVLNTMKLVES